MCVVVIVLMRALFGVGVSCCGLVLFVCVASVWCGVGCFVLL